VKKYLVEHGINGQMLSTKSFGESKPIDTNKTDEARAKNRRIEFHEIE
jgi:outer membrane protein OmpA-like peptidoglycan-associated protein